MPHAEAFPPDFLAVGHIAKDVSSGRFRLGGAVVYGALAALKLGRRPAVVTSAAPDLEPASLIEGIPLHVVPSAETTTFHNAYHKGRRTQQVTSVAAPLTAADVPSGWRSAPLVLLAPLVDEVDADVATHFPGSLIAADMQGWLRQWDASGEVQPRYWEGRDVLPHVDTAVVSAEDVEDHRLIALWAGLTPVLVVTMGAEGARLHSQGRWSQVAPFATREVDPTGAGDVFAAAYLIRYAETSDPLDSARFASCAASFCVEAEGLAGIPTRAQVEQRLRTS